MFTQEVDGIAYNVREILGKYDVRPVVPNADRRRTVLFDASVVERQGSVADAVTYAVRRALASTQTTFTIELDNGSDEFEWEDSREELTNIFESADADYFRIDGENMGWTHASGFTVARADKVVEKLFLNGDFRLVFTFLEGVLTNAPVKVIRYSHDEPVGASFTIAPATEQEVEDFA